MSEPSTKGSRLYRSPGPGWSVVVRDDRLGNLKVLGNLLVLAKLWILRRHPFMILRYRKECLRFQDLTAASMKLRIFWDVLPCY
jgi:hypothetical protein